MIRRIIIEPEILWGLYWGNGYSLRQISNIFGCSCGDIRKRMIEYGIPRRSLADADTNKYNIIVEPELLESLYWGNGCTLDQISDIFGCCLDTIWNRMIEYGIPSRSDNCELITFTFNNRQKQIFDGLMLGDGGLTWWTNYCCFSNSDIHEEYLIWLQKQLDIEDISNIAVRIDGVYRLITRVIPSIRDEHKRWYPYKTRKGTFQNHNNKVIPKNIELTPIKMLFWYIGDGTYSKKDKTAMFTNCLIFETWNSLLKKICKVLNVDDGFSINKHSKDKEGVERYTLRLNKAVTRKFFDMVDSLGFDIPECYQYKFGGCCDS